MHIFKWRDIRIRFKYAFVLITTILLFVLATGFVSTSLSQIKEAISTIEITAERSIALTQMNSLFNSKQLIISDYVALERKSLIEEYDQVAKDFEALRAQVEPKMDLEEMQFIFNLINKNNSQMDDTFKNTVVVKMQEGNHEEATTGYVKVSSLRNPTAQLFDNLKVQVDDYRQQAISHTYAVIAQSITVLILSILVAAVFGILTLYLISRGITRNLNGVVLLTEKIAQGDLAIEEAVRYGKDEIGQLASAMYTMIHNLRTMIQQISESALTVDQESSELRKIADEVSEGSHQIAATMQQMSAGAEDQAHSAGEIAHSISVLTDLIEEANTNKNVLETSSKDILNVVQKGNVQMGTSIENMNQINQIIKNAVQNVQQLDESSEKVSTLVQVIHAIAEQTNLLALNAAIEAARAGEAGKGFAVVADEIRKLAEQVSNSVKEITDIVLGIQNNSKLVTQSLEVGYQEIEAGSSQIKQTGEVFDTIHQEVLTMIEKIDAVSFSLNNISENGQKISEAGDQVAAISEENSAGIEQTVASLQQQSSSMELVAQNATALSDSSDKLKDVVNQFKL
ncbi:MAG: methyl-accepting chemotaxis protein [Thermotaleaceae bacterium]